MQRFFIAMNDYGGNTTRFQVSTEKNCLEILRDNPIFTTGKYVEEKLITTEGLDVIRTYKGIASYNIINLYQTLTVKDLETIAAAHDIHVTPITPALYDVELYAAVLQHVRRKDLMQYIIDHMNE